MRCLLMDGKSLLETIDIENCLPTIKIPMYKELTVRDYNPNNTLSSFGLDIFIFKYVETKNGCAIYQFHEIDK